MLILRGKKEEILKKIEESEPDEEVYINKEIDRDIAISLLDNIEPKIIYIPISKYKRTSKRILKALEGVGIKIKAVKPKTGRPTNVDKIIKKYLHLKPEEIAKKTGLNIKTVEYHYYKLKKGKNA